MACFSDLPQELVDYIVELATPSFSTRGWKERYKTLKTLHLVNETFLQPARRLLAREIAVDSSSALDAFETLLGRTLDTVPNEQYLHPKLLVVKRTRNPSTRWSSPTSEDDSARIMALVDKLQPLVLATGAFDIERTDNISGVQCRPLRLLVLDSRFVKSTLDYPERFPSSLQILRLKLDPDKMDHSDDAEGLLALLSSSSFSPRLHELHLISKSFGDKEVVNAMRGCEDWCSANGVKLYLEQVDDFLKPFDPSFWRFLDSIKKRLELDV
ncbi:hypothetical protein JCM6882_000371 [Rhodosporidiobolus microsporus]